MPDWTLAASRRNLCQTASTIRWAVRTVRLATWNVNSLGVRMPHLLDWLASAQPDAAVLQETKLEDERFPHEQLGEAGYHAVFHGQKTYNGVALISRTPAEGVLRNIP